MRALCLLLVLCAACAKKPAAKAPAAPPPADKDMAPAPGAPPPASEPSESMQRRGDPCEGGEHPKKPH